MLNITANCSEEVWESESLPRSAREADKIVPLMNPRTASVPRRPLSSQDPAPYQH